MSWVPVKGQDSTYISNQVWSLFYMDWNMGYLHGDLTFEYDTEFAGNKEYYSASVEPGLEYYPNNSFDLYTNIYIAYTRQYRHQTSTEIRPMIGARWNIVKPEHRFYLKAQAQMEYRFFYSHNMDTEANSGRFRLMLNNQVSLNQKNYNSDNNLYLITKIERFLHLRNNISERFWNENRIYAGLGFKRNVLWRIEAMYIYQGSKDNRLAERPDTVENILELIFKLHFSRRNKNSD